MNDKKISYQEAIMRDKLLFELSMYDVSGGMMKIYKTHEEVEEIQEKAVVSFNRYKKIIQSGEFTFEEIMDDIIARNSATTRNLKKVNLESDESINKMINEFEKNVHNMEADKFLKDKFGIIQSILDNFGPMLDKYEGKDGKPTTPDK